MSEQLTIRLPEELSRALDTASARMQRKRSEIIRLALYQFLDVAPHEDEAPASRVRHLIGSLETGIPDLAENHRAYILESLKRGS